MNMFKATKEKTVKGYLAAVPKERQELMLFLHGFIQKTVPKLKTYFASNMLGYGSFPYRNYKNESIEWPVIALANQKNYVSLYVCAVDNGIYIAEKYKKDLGNVSVGKSCIRFKKDRGHPSVDPQKDSAICDQVPRAQRRGRKIIFYY